jgi:hypothetical protein
MLPSIRNALIVGVLTFFFLLPTAIVMIGGGAAAISGFLVIGCLTLLQAPVFYVLKRVGFLSTDDPRDPK